MKVLSWDIGIKNLAYCLIEYCNDEMKIISWDVINIQGSENKTRNYTCEFTIPKKGCLCGKKAKHYQYGTWTTYCGTHVKKIDSLESQLISKRKCNHILKNNTRCQKNIKFETEHGLEGYCTIHAKNKDISVELLPIEKKQKSNLHQISRNLISILDEINFAAEIDIILIENQPAFKNPKMKSIQMILYTYFVIRYQVDMKNIHLGIYFMMANNKLKVKLPNLELQEKYQKDINHKYKTKYQRFKELGKTYCGYYLENEKNLKQWQSEYQKHQKQDDLADTFLMCVYYLQNSKKFKV